MLCEYTIFVSWYSFSVYMVFALFVSLYGIYPTETHELNIILNKNDKSTFENILFEGKLQINNNDCRKM